MLASALRLSATWWTDAQRRPVLLAALLVAFTIPLDLALYLWSGWSALWPIREWLLGSPLEGGDSWNVMNRALAFVRAHPDEPLYQNIFFEQQLKFQYAPTSLLPLVGLQALGLDTGVETMNAINRGLIALTALAVGVVAWLALRKLKPEAVLERQAAAVIAAGATLLFYPVMMGYHLGQLQVWINALFAFAVVAWLTDRRILTGALIALICVLKPQFGLFAVWALLRREWRFLGGLAAVGGVCLIASVALFGFANHVDYLGVLSHLSRHGEAYWANQSANGLFQRLVGLGPLLEWEANSLPPYHPLVYFGTLLTSLAIVAAALLIKRGDGAMARVTDFLLAALAFTIASPIAWEHHYGVLAPMLAVLLCLVLAMPESRDRRAWLIALAAVYMLSAICFDVTRALPGLLSVFQLYLYVAALGALVMLRRLSRRSPAPASRS